MNKKYIAVMTALILATPALKADEVGVGVDLFTYRKSEPVGVGVSGVSQAQLPVYQPGVVTTQAPAQQAPAPQAAAPVALLQPDGTLRLVTIVPQTPAPLVKKKEVRFGPRLTFFRTREW